MEVLLKFSLNFAFSILLLFCFSEISCCGKPQVEHDMFSKFKISLNSFKAFVIFNFVKIFQKKIIYKKTYKHIYMFKT